MVENLQFFGGRGASSGLSDKGKKYGSEYRVATSNLFDTMILVRQNHQWKQ